MTRRVWHLAPLLGILVAAQPRALALLGDTVPTAVPGAPICATEHVWSQSRLARSLAEEDVCVPLGACDAPGTRDAVVRHPFTARLIVHVMNSSAGDPPSGIVQSDVDVAIAELNARYAPYNVEFDLVATRYHNDDAFHCIAPLSFFNDDWRIDIENMKLAYAEEPDTHLNVFVACQESSFYGVLGGFAIFPWDPVALTHGGGLWVNSDFFGAGKTVFTHEVGHCLGLWHSHRGVNETADCADPCTENVHASDDPLADLVGDFCKDTPATPANSACTDPTGTDCDSVAWGATDFTNYMGYGNETCVDHFTDEQVDRMHCWTRDALSSLIDEHITLVHVQSVRVQEEVNGALRRAVGEVQVVDAEGVPVENLRVRARWQKTYEAAVEAVTDADGVATFTTPWFFVSAACWMLQVDDLNDEGFVYDLTANVSSAHWVGSKCGRGGGGKEPFADEVVVLEGIKPNPFNPVATIVFSLPRASRVRLGVYDLAGRRVASLLDERRVAGTHEVLWRGRDDRGRRAASGVYVAVLEAGETVRRHRMVLLK